MHEKTKQAIDLVDKAHASLQAREYIIKVLLAHVDKSVAGQDFKNRWKTEWAKMDGLISHEIEVFIREKLDR